jgi:hypothetical protein
MWGIDDGVQGNPITIYHPIPNEALPSDFTSAAFAGPVYHPRAQEINEAATNLPLIDKGYETSQPTFSQIG